MTRKNYLAISILLLITSAASAQIKLQLFSSGYTAPVDIKNCGDERLFIVEQNGVISICDTDGVRRSNPFLNIASRVQYGGEQGLLGLAFSPDYKTSGIFYVDYTAAGSGETHISRFHVPPSTPDSADPNSEEILLRIYQPYSNHNGGHVGFGPDGYLYIGMGDGGNGGDPGNRAQNPDSLLGKILRIDVDTTVGYKIPPTNAFASDTSLGRGEIWTLGMRNPWRWSFDQVKGDLWIADVGQNAIEEIDLQPAGSPGGMNYGWRCYEANAPYNTTVNCQAYSYYTAPIYQYSHSPGGYCSITGGYIYRGTKYGELYGKYFYADYCKSQIQYITSDGHGGFTNTNLDTLGATSVTTFGLDSHRELYCSSSGGKIFRFYSLNCAPTAMINDGKDTLSDCGFGSVNLFVTSDSTYTYSWENNGSTVANVATYQATQSGMYIVHVDNNNGCTNTDSVYVELIIPPTVTFTGLDSVMCVYHSAVNLSPSQLGGTFSGAGITGATFDPNVAGIGTHVISYSITDANGCSYGTLQTVHVDACLGVPENSWTNKIDVYPNPSANDFNIHAYSSKERKVKMEITDAMGRTISSETFVFSNGDNVIPVSLNVAKGMYVMKFTDDVSSSSVRIFIQ